MGDITTHFSLSELTTTDTGLDNTPPQAILPRLVNLAHELELVRTLLGANPMTIDSAFRSAAVNAAVGGVPDSAHAIGYAADFTCEGYGDPYTIAKHLSLIPSHVLRFDQLIYEGTWVHISFDPRVRRQVLTHHDDGSYTSGL